MYKGQVVFTIIKLLYRKLLIVIKIIHYQTIYWFFDYCLIKM